MYLPELLFRRWPAVLIALLALMVLSSPLRADDDDDDDDLQAAINCDAGDDLQTAIGAAVDGDVLTIKGTCRGTFGIFKNLTLEGTPKATLDGNGAGPVVTIFGGSVVLENLNIMGGGGCGVAAGLDIFDSEVTLVSTSVIGNHT